MEKVHQHVHLMEGESNRSRPADAARFMKAAELFRALSEPTRIHLFWLLCHHQECPANLAVLLGLSPSNLAHHLKEMKNAGLLESRRMGKEVHYRVADREACRLLHPMVEQVLQLSCPEENSFSHQEVVRRVHDHLVENLEQRLTAEELSRQFLINTTTLKALFRQQYGLSMAAHVRHHRLEKAREMLLETDMTVQEIAGRVGFSSQSRFAEAFRKAYGALPTQYRKHRK